MQCWEMRDNKGDGKNLEIVIPLSVLLPKPNTIAIPYTQISRREKWLMKDVTEVNFQEFGKKALPQSIPSHFGEHRADF